jgi:hypothetical protein
VGCTAGQALESRTTPSSEFRNNTPVFLFGTMILHSAADGTFIYYRHLHCTEYLGFGGFIKLHSGF